MVNIGGHKGILLYGLNIDGHKGDFTVSDRESKNKSEYQQNSISMEVYTFVTVSLENQSEKRRLGGTEAGRDDDFTIGLFSPPGLNFYGAESAESDFKMFGASTHPLELSRWCHYGRENKCTFFTPSSFPVILYCVGYMHVSFSSPLHSALLVLRGCYFVNLCLYNSIC